MSVDELRKEIEEKPDNAMPHYYLGKRLFSEPLKDLNSFEEIKKEFNNAIELAPKLYMAHYYLGRLFFILKDYKEAEKKFREVLKIRSNSILAREYLAKCLSASGALDISPGKRSVRDLFFLFENEIRNFIGEKLKQNFGETWWRKGVPDKIRGDCAKRHEEGLDEERDANLLHFADFHDYRLIIEKNKNIFANCFDTKKWQAILSELEPIRNAIGHNRNLSEKAEAKVRKYYSDFQKIAKIK